MLHPLVSLWRHSCRVTFYESGGAVHAQFPQPGSPALGMGLGMRRRFRGQDDAKTYLRYWAGDPGAQAEIRWMAQRLGAPAAGGRQPQEAGLEALAGLLVAGVVLVVEETARGARPGRLVAPPSAAAGAAASLASMPALSSLPQVPAVPNLLPVLEDIQVEGAEVLPELNQAMAEVQATLSTVDTAGASLAPAPSKVGGIQSAMDQAAADSTRGLDEA